MGRGRGKNGDVGVVLLRRGKLTVDGWLTTTRPMKCIVPGRFSEILGSKDNYFESERVLCTQAFSTAAVSTTINDGEYPPGSTELEDKTGRNCNMAVVQY